MKIRGMIPAVLAGVAMVSLVGCGSTSPPTSQPTSQSSVPEVLHYKPVPSLMRETLRKVAPTFNTWTDTMLDTSATEICTGFDSTQDASQVSSVLYNSGTGIPPSDLGALMAYSVSSTCPEYQAELNVWAASSGY